MPSSRPWTLTARVGIIALAWLASAAAGEPSVPDGERPTWTPREQAAIVKFLAEAARQTREMLDQGKFDKALEKAKALETLAPVWAGWAETARDLKLEAQDGLQSSRLVRGQLEGPTTSCQIGDQVVLRVILKNLTDLDADIDMGRPGSGKAAFLTVRFEEHGFMGGTGLREWRLRIGGFEGRRVLKPGETWSCELVIDTADMAPLNPTIRKYRIDGSVRPVEMTLGRRALLRPIRLPAISFEVLPRGLGPMRREPLSTLREAIEEESGPKVFLAARFIERDQQHDAISDLLEASARQFDDPAFTRALRVALRTVTGRRDVPLTGPAWKRWIAKNREALLGRNGNDSQ